MSFTSGNRLVSEKDRSRSDRYHQQRLDEIRTSKNKDSPIPHRMDNRKGALLEEGRKEQIDRENELLLEKMTKIMDKKPEVQAVHSVRSNRPRLLDEMLHHMKPRVAQARSSYSQDKVMPSWMHHRLSIKLAAKVQQGLSSAQPSPAEAEPPKNAAKESYESAMRYLNSLKENSSLREKKDIEDRFNKPEQLFERVVLYKKSCIYNDTSYLVEISAAYGKLIVLIFDIMNPKLVRRLVLNQSKTHKLLNEFEYDYAALASQLVISNESAVLIRRYSESDRKFEPGESQHSNPGALKKVQFQKQQEFLDRNFYKEVKKRKKAVEAFETERIHPQLTQQSGSIVNSRVNTSSELKPTTAISNIRKRFQFEIPEKQKGKRKEKFGAIPGYTSYVIRQERTESDGKGDTLRDQDIRKTARATTNGSRRLTQEKKPYLNGFRKDKAKVQQKEQPKKRDIARLRPSGLREPLKINKEDGERDMPSISSPLSPIHPKRDAYREEEPSSDYPEQFEQELQKVDRRPGESNPNEQKYDAGYGEQFEQDAEYPVDKPESRLRQQRHNEQHLAQQSDESSQLLQDPDAEGDGQYEQYENEGEEHNPDQGEEGENYEQEFEDRPHDMALTENNSKPMFEGNPSGQYEQDFEISESQR